MIINQIEEKRLDNQVEITNPGEQYTQDDDHITYNPMPEPSKTGEDEEESTDPRKEHEDKDHQHDYKTPIGIAFLTQEFN